MPTIRACFLTSFACPQTAVGVKANKPMKPTHVCSRRGPVPVEYTSRSSSCASRRDVRIPARGQARSCLDVFANKRKPAAKGRQGMFPEYRQSGRERASLGFRDHTCTGAKLPSEWLF